MNFTFGLWPWKLDDFEFNQETAHQDISVSLEHSSMFISSQIPLAANARDMYTRVP